jgi:CRISPR-associated endoribonuclease Cas6
LNRLNSVVSVGPDIDFTGLPPVLPLRVVLRARGFQSIPAFLGSALHGALGRALWKTVCAFPRRRECAGCPLLSRCAYPALFASRAPTDTLEHVGIRDQAPRPMVLAPEELETLSSGHPRLAGAGTEISFRLTLIGRAVDDLALLVIALRQMAQGGIGKPHNPSSADEPQARYAGAELVRITSYNSGKVVYDADTELVSTPAAITPDALQWPNDGAAGIAIRLLTPLRLKRDGKFQGRPSPADFLLTLVRRANALTSLYGDGGNPIDEGEVQAAVAEIQAQPPQTRLVHVRRYSARQQRRMEWPGVIGVLRWRGGALDKLGPLLKFGEMVQLGKGTALGFGRYAIEDLADAPGGT